MTDTIHSGCGTFDPVEVLQSKQPATPFLSEPNSFPRFSIPAGNPLDHRTNYAT